MASRLEASRENGKKGGRPPGSKRQTTLAREAAQEHARQRITARLDPLIDEWLAIAEGFKYLVVRDKNTGKFLRNARHNEKVKPNEEIIEVWERPPSGQAIRDLLDRALGKPQEPKQDIHLTGDWSKLAARLASARKRGQEARKALEE